MALVLKESPTETWLEQFGQYGVHASPVQEVSQLLDDDQLAALKQLQEIQLPDEEGPSVRLPRLPIEFSPTPTGIAGPPPHLGEHGRDILSEVGFSDGEIESLAHQGVIRLA